MNPLAMNPRTLMLAAAALATAGLTAYLVQGWITHQRAELLAQRPGQVVPAAPNQVLVAKKDMPAGTFVKPELMQWRAWPSEGIDANFIRKGRGDMKAFSGAVVRKGIVAGEPITVKRVVKPGERGFLAAVLSPGKRAVSVKVNDASGISGLVFPGDQVDVLLAYKFEIKGENKARAVRRAGETVLTDVRVLAMGQTTDDQKGKPISAKTATLEVTPKQAEMVAVATQLGKLSLSLRSLARTDEELAKEKASGKPRRKSRKRGITRDSEVGRMLGMTGNGAGHTVHVIHGEKSMTQQLRRAVR